MPTIGHFFIARGQSLQAERRTTELNELIKRVSPICSAMNPSRKFVGVNFCEIAGEIKPYEFVFAGDFDAAWKSACYWLGSENNVEYIGHGRYHHTDLMREVPL